MAYGGASVALFAGCDQKLGILARMPRVLHWRIVADSGQGATEGEATPGAGDCLDPPKSKTAQSAGWRPRGFRAASSQTVNCSWFRLEPRWTGASGWLLVTGCSEGQSLGPSRDRGQPRDLPTLARRMRASAGALTFVRFHRVGRLRPRELRPGDCDPGDCDPEPQPRS
jgi:hypothetical protein